MGKEKQLKIQPIQDGCRDIKTPEYLPKLPCNTIFCGVAGSGKTTALINLLHYYVKHNLCDRLFIVSPTYHSNKKLFNGLPIYEDDVYEPEDESCVGKIKEKIDKEAEDFEEYWRKKKLYDKVMKQFQNGIRPNLNELYDIYNPLTNEFEVPEHWLNGKCAICHLVVDDSQQTPIYRSKQFRNINTKFRHMGPFNEHNGAITLSIHHCIQNFKAQGGMPKEIRANMTTLAIFKTFNEKAIEEVIDECSGHLSKEDFIELYNKATNEAKSFLFIDFKPQNESLRHRKRFDEPL
jgi:hypothetical protein